MKTSRTFLTILAICALSLTARAADATPAGHWEWPDQGPQGKAVGSCDLVVEHGVVTGSLTTMGSTGQIKPGTFKDGIASFDIVLEGHGGMQFLFSFTGKLDGDKITGTVERPTPPAGERKRMEWVATRSH